MLNKCNVSILAGGLGKRLRSVSGDIPKPMVKILGKPLLEYQIELCKTYGFLNIALLVFYNYECISDYFGDGAKFGVNLTYVLEGRARGTAGALRDAQQVLAENFLVIYGDTYLDVNLQDIWNSHVSSGADATLFLHPNDHPYDSDLVLTDDCDSVISIYPYPRNSDTSVGNMVNAGLYVLKNFDLDNVTSSKDKSDIAKDMFPKMLENNKTLKGYYSPEYIKDMGTPERLNKVTQDIISGMPEKLSTRNLRSAVFMDRDGTINIEKKYINNICDIELLPATASAIHRLNRSGKLAVIVTNQPVVARGELSIDGLNLIHAKLHELLGREGAYIDQTYFCPHHPEAGFKGENISLKIKCQCRKPSIGLIDKACYEMSISREHSWMVGDSTSDIEAGRRSGLKTILVRTGYGGSDRKYDVKPDYIVDHLGEAVDWILESHNMMKKKLAPIAIEVSRGSRLVLIGGLSRAGKSCAAQVLKELLFSLGIKTHAISTDGWLMPPSLRKEGAGVKARYETKEIVSTITSALKDKSRSNIFERLNNKSSREIDNNKILHSVGPEDVIILEGVVALLLEELCRMPKVIKIYIDIDLNVRIKRLENYYNSRGLKGLEFERLMKSREGDEVSLIKQTMHSADFVLTSGTEGAYDNK